MLPFVIFKRSDTGLPVAVQPQFVRAVLSVSTENTSIIFGEGESDFVFVQEHFLGVVEQIGMGFKL